MLKVISHRGAAGLAPENTLVGIETAKKYRADIIEIDVQPTSDNRLVLVHDDNLSRVAGDSRKIRDLPLREINLIQTKSGQPIPTLEEALETAGRKQLLIDCYGFSWAAPLADIIKNHRGPKPLVASNNFQELLELKKACPEVMTFYSELTKPFEAIQTAKVLRFSGVCLLYSLYNPLVYFLAKRLKLQMTMYTVNRPIVAWFLHLLYPQVMITTDLPNKIKPHRRKIQK
ncbi:glycerophosphodiester phosphodiesterase [Candidatus Parcubacteria bacterium]|nr:glycerophosphodiester phosphodiesterase [Candidatus Parcubacteria bacterium]